MAKRPIVERRKNPSRKREIAFDVVYQVRWNEDRHSFDVYRGKEDAGRGYACDKATAVALAVRAAQREDAGLKVCVSSVQNGKITVEWSR